MGVPIGDHAKKKNGDVRIYIDMQMANSTINHEHHPTPTSDDLIHTLNGPTVFVTSPEC